MTASAFVAFVPFVEQVLGVVFTPAQRVLALVVFDGLDPVDLPSEEERAIARLLFGDVEKIPALARAVLVAVCGARGGKTYLAALRLLHLALTVRLELAPGEQAFAIFIAPDMRLATQGLRYAAGAVRESPALARCVEGKIGSEGFTLRRPHDGQLVRFEALPATAGGSAVRGRNLVGVVMDEGAFFRDEFSAVNDEDVFNGFVARIVPGGQALIMSTAWSQAGLLFKEFTANHGGPKTAIAVHAPTLLLRDNEHTRALVARERLRDPENARREYDAEFLPRGGGSFFDPTAIEGSIADYVTPRGASLTAAIDAGFRSDASALVIVASIGDQFAAAHVEELRPEKGAPLKPSEVIGTFARSLKSWGVSRVAADQFYVEAVREHLAEHGLGLIEAPAGQLGKVTTHMRARTIIHEGRLLLPKTQKRLVDQLKSIEQRPTAGGGLQIHTPRRAGGHGDIASALILALWAAEARPGLVDPDTLDRAFDHGVEPLLLEGEVA